ncbi:MAG TPA: DUF937 domain-containing protein [Aestuariivirga sp.]|nr:DUF937 domain-containing protein [Aestuariivirga sp.]
MTLMSILATSDNGNYFGNVAQACNMSAAMAKSALERLCPAIATQLKEKMQSDNNAFEALLDLLDEGGDLDGLTDSESIEDGKAVLQDLYGSPAAALAEMKRLAPGLDDSQYENISAISATSVLAVLAKSYATPATLASSEGEAPQGGGLLATIIAAIIKGLLQGVRSQLAPRRRRRRSYTSYFGTRRKTTRRRRRATAPTLEDIFGQILGTRK